MDVLAAISWDPQIRGFLIFLVSLVILAGSVFLLLSTNVGSRVAFLLCVAGLSGWMMLLGLLWTVTPSATGPKGRDPSWEVKAAVTGEIGETAEPPLDVPFEDGWIQLEEGDAQAAEVQTRVEEFLSEAPEAAGFGFNSSADYILEASYDRGGERKGPFDVLNFRPFNVFHEPHYAAVRVQPAVEQEIEAGEAPPEPRPDLSREPVTVLLERDLGTRRLPVFLVFLGSGILFAVSLAQLHRRDKIAMAARAAAGAPAGAR